MTRVLNKVIVITGGASGIGEATCHLLAKEGAVVALTDINDSAGKDTVQKIKQEGGELNFGIWTHVLKLKLSKSCKK